MALSRWSTGLLLLATACGGTLPAASITSVQPSQVRANVATLITIRMQGVLPTRADYGSGSISSDSAVTVFVDDVQIARTRVDASGNINATLPANLPPKTYDLIVTLGDGRKALLGGAIDVSR